MLAGYNLSPASDTVIMMSEESRPKYRLVVSLHDRRTDKPVHSQTIEGNNQFQLLVKIWHIARGIGDHKKHYLIVKTDGCMVRPRWLIKQLKAYRIPVIEPEKYENGEIGLRPLPA